MQTPPVTSERALGFHGKFKMVLPGHQRKLKDVASPGTLRFDLVGSHRAELHRLNSLTDMISFTCMVFHIFLNYKFILNIGRCQLNHLYLMTGIPSDTWLPSFMTLPASGTSPVSFAED